MGNLKRFPTRCALSSVIAHIPHSSSKLLDHLSLTTTNPGVKRDHQRYCPLWRYKYVFFSDQYSILTDYSSTDKQQFCASAYLSQWLFSPTGTPYSETRVLINNLLHSFPLQTWKLGAHPTSHLTEVPPRFPVHLQMQMHQILYPVLRTLPSISYHMKIIITTGQEVGNTVLIAFHHSTISFPHGSLICILNEIIYQYPLDYAFILFWVVILAILHLSSISLLLNSILWNALDRAGLNACQQQT